MTPCDEKKDDLLALMGLGAKSGRKSHYPELKLRISELERVRILLDRASDAIFLLSIPEGIVEFENKPALELSGLQTPPEERRLGDYLRTPQGAPLSIFSLFPLFTQGEQRKIVPLSTPEGERRFEASFQVAVEGGRSSGVLILRDQEKRIDAEERLAASLGALEEARMRTIRLISALIEMKDMYTGRNQRRTAQLADVIGHRLDLPDEKRRDLVTVALLHDVGIMGIPAEILCIPGPFRDVDRRLVQEHSRIGADILIKEGFPEEISNSVLCHHERMNGSGYPSGLSGEAIPLYARIVGAADVTEAMLSHRPYRPAHPREEVIREMEEGRRVLYDERVSDICASLIWEGFELEE